MPSTYTTSLRLELQAAGENLNSWGAPKLNNVISRIEKGVAGWATVALTGNYTLTTSNSADDEARSAMLKFTGTGDYTVTIPSVSKSYVIWNACSGPVIVSTGAGSTVVVDAADKVLVFCDGTNVHTLGYSSQTLKAYIAAAALTATGTLPGATGHDGKVLYASGGAWGPKALETSDVTGLAATIAEMEADNAAFQANFTGFAVAFAAAL